jgi:hypothetical protein
MKKVYCKRTCFYSNTQLPEYWDKKVKWEKNKIYTTMPVNNYMVTSLSMSSSIIFVYIETESSNYYAPTTKKEFDMYFMTIEEARDKKINNILNE